MTSLKKASEIVDAPMPRHAGEWASVNRVFPKHAPEPGHFKQYRTPYTEEVYRAFIDPLVLQVTFILATQGGKSVTLENLMGWKMDDDPVPVLYVAPTKNMLARAILPKIKDMVSQCRTLSAKYDARESDRFSYFFGGVKARFAWSGSPAELAADSAGLVLVDEVDRLIDTVEGSTVDIIEARGDAYCDSKIGYVSTPTRGIIDRSTHPVSGVEHWSVVDHSKVSSKVWQLWQSGTRHEWSVPCPYCNEFFAPYSGLLFPGKNEAAQYTPDEAEKIAGLNCPHCKKLITDKYRQLMNKRGVFVAPGESVSKDGEITGTADTAGFTHKSYWVSGLCSFSQKKSYGYCAKRLVEAHRTGDLGKLLSVYNTKLGECYAKESADLTWKDIKSQVYNYKLNSLIADSAHIFCTVDVQEKYLVYVTRAWWPGMGSALIDNDEILGRPDRPEVWYKLSQLFDEEWNGNAIKLMGIDCGYLPDEVMPFVWKYRSSARALRGGSISKLFRAAKDSSDKYDNLKIEFSSSRAKSFVHNRIGSDHDGSKFWLLPSDIEDDYCKQLVGEHYDLSTDKWLKTNDNHYLDCEAMQFILAKVYRLDKSKSPVFLDDLVGDNEEDEEEIVIKSPEKTDEINNKNAWVSVKKGPWL